MVVVRHNNGTGGTPGEVPLYPGQTAGGGDDPFDEILNTYHVEGGTPVGNPSWSAQAYGAGYRFDGSNIGSQSLNWYFTGEPGCGGRMQFYIENTLQSGPDAADLWLVQVETLSGVSCVLLVTPDGNVVLTVSSPALRVPLTDENNTPFVVTPDTYYALEWAFIFDPGHGFRVRLDDGSGGFPATASAPTMWPSVQQFGNIRYGIGYADGATNAAAYQVSDLGVNTSGLYPGEETTTPVVDAPPIEAGAEILDWITAPHIHAPPIEAGVEQARGSFGTVILTVPAPIQVAADVVRHGPVRQLKVPAPITVGASPRIPAVARLRRGLADPRNLTVVPSTRPRLTVGLAPIGTDAASLGDVAVDIQVAATAAFTTPTTYHRAVTLDAATTYVTVEHAPAGNPVAEHSTWFWRARTVLAGTAQEWTAAWSFTVDSSTGEHLVMLNGTVTAGPTDPHLWFAHPDAGVPGAEVTLIGQGFPTAAAVTLAGHACTVVSQTRVAATDAATAAGRTIATTPTITASTFGVEVRVDPQHDEIVIVVPDAAAPGGALTITGDDGA